MAETRIQMPDGETFRTRTTRRYVVVARGPNGPWQAAYRSDVESRAVAQWRHEARIAEHANLIDTTTKTVIR